MTTPDTAAVRSWAREQGLVVADRGRLPAEVVDAYTAAHPAGSRSAPADRARGARKPGTTPGRRPTAGRSAATPGQRAEKPASPRRKTARTGPEPVQARPGQAEPRRQPAGATERAAERTAEPTAEPTTEPTAAPTAEPTSAPTAEPIAGAPERAVEPLAGAGEQRPTEAAAVPAPAAAEDGRRLAELVEQVTALSQRVAALEAAAAAVARPARSRFRLRR